MELTQYKLGEIGEIRMCKRILKEETNDKEGVPFYKIGTFGGKADVFISREKFEDYKMRYSYPKKGDVLISAAGTIGKTVIFDGNDSYFQDSNIVWIDNDETKVLNKYLFYCYKNIQWYSSTGSTILRLYNDNIRYSIIRVPHIGIQENIASALQNIDRKISLNLSINQNLEALAKQIYDYWFVQFDFPDENGRPYKSSGGQMVWNDKLKREIPIGWKDALVKDVISQIERGISYSSEEIASPDGKPMINLACYSKQGNYRVGEMKFFSGNIKEEDKVFPYDMLIACTDMTQGADVIGRPILATEEYEWFVYSMDLAKITPKEIGKMYLYYTLRTPFYHKYIKPFASGTTVKHLNVLGVENYKISVPHRAIQEKFEKIITAIKQQQMIIINENNDLTKQRDELLPLLMNGQVTIE